MKETIAQIADSIRVHRDKEITSETGNNSIGRSRTLFKGKDYTFWLTSKQPTIIKFEYDFNGNIDTSTAAKAYTTCQEDGQVIQRDSRLGELLVGNHEGKHTFKAPGGEMEVTIFNRASYIPIPDQNEYAADVTIRMAGDDRIYSFQCIRRILELQAGIAEDKENLSRAAADKEAQQEANRLARRIEAQEEEMKSYVAKAQGFIRKYAALRYQPVLDPVQDAIKRSRIFEGTLIINGGPGTGKTTSLIQRIKFLISPTIAEYIPVHRSQVNLLFDQKASWIFYSPSELLALFLRNSMAREELAADTEHVKVWSAHRNELVKRYKLVDTSTKRPFLFYKSSGTNLLANNRESISRIISELEKFYLDYQRLKLSRVEKMDVSPFRWKHSAASIQSYITGKDALKTMDDAILLFQNLQLTFKAETDQITKEYKELAKTVAAGIVSACTKDPERARSLSELLKKWKTDGQETEEAEEEAAELEIEQEDFEEREELIGLDFERELWGKTKSLCRKLAMQRYDKSTKLNKRDRELLELIPEAKQRNEYEQLGQAAFFKKYFERIVKGVDANILREIPMMYKKFRREQLLAKSCDWNLPVLEKLVGEDRNIRLHDDERALLLYFINRICARVIKQGKLTEDIRHPYLDGYKDNCKPVIAVDEATDFSIIDLLAIESFRHPSISSVTLAGDIMQRMTASGLDSWEDISPLVEDTEIKDLEISYRQSPTLLSLAGKIYSRSTGKRPNYRSYINKDEAEPKPLLLVSDDEEEKVNWIADRIGEIYRAYGDSIPSIAIFLPDEGQLESFAELLGSLGSLSDVGIMVKACRNGEVLGDSNTVRIFSVDKIKGLEFEAVFFYDIDRLQHCGLSDDMLLKYLYVGLSRATFYMGLTVSEELDGGLAFLTESFDATGKTWGIG